MCFFLNTSPSQNNKSLVQELTRKESGQKLFKHAICYHIKFFFCRNVDSLQRVLKTILPKTLVRSSSEVCYCNEYSISFFVSKVRAKNICIRVLLLWLFFRAYTAILDDYGTYKDFYVIIVIMFREWLFSLAVDLSQTANHSANIIMKYNNFLVKNVSFSTFFSLKKCEKGEDEFIQRKN